MVFWSHIIAYIWQISDWIWEINWNDKKIYIKKTTRCWSRHFDNSIVEELKFSRSVLDPSLNTKKEVQGPLIIGVRANYLVVREYPKEVDKLKRNILRIYAMKYLGTINRLFRTQTEYNGAPGALL